MTSLTPDEASAAADCVAAMLEDFANLDPACVLMVWAGAVHVDHYGGDKHFHRPVNEPATQSRVAAARAALVKLYGMAEPTFARNLEYVESELLEFLDEEAVPDWLATRQFTLNNRTPLQALRDGDLAGVMAVVNATEHGAYT